MMRRILVKARDDRTDKIPASHEESIQNAIWSLDTVQLDRYYRADRVWYNTKTNKFEFEDRLVR